MASKLEKPPQKAADSVEEFLSQLPYPMLGLDEKRRLTSRNFSDTVNIHTPRKQASIDPLLSSADRKKLDSLEDGEETVVELRGESTRSAIVARRRDGYLVALRDLTATLASKIARRGCEPPPFFRLTVGQIDRMGQMRIVLGAEIEVEYLFAQCYFAVREVDGECRRFDGGRDVHGRDVGGDLRQQEHLSGGYFAYAYVDLVFDGELPVL